MWSGRVGVVVGGGGVGDFFLTKVPFVLGEGIFL